MIGLTLLGTILARALGPTFGRLATLGAWRTFLARCTLGAVLATGVFVLGSKHWLLAHAG